jgi:hypothetical protein
MNTRLPSLLTKLLPTLALPVLLLGSGTADAASLSISNGFFSARTLTSVGWDFYFQAQGVVTHDGQDYASSIVLDCSVNEYDETLDCVGVQEIGNASQDIRMTNVDDTAYWAIDVNSSANAKSIHREWGAEIAPEFMPTGDGGVNWINWHDGFKWRKWYYSSSWADCYTALSGLQYGDIWLE